LGPRLSLRRTVFKESQVYRLKATESLKLGLHIRRNRNLDRFFQADYAIQYSVDAIGGFAKVKKVTQCWIGDVAGRPTA